MCKDILTPQSPNQEPNQALDWVWLLLLNLSLYTWLEKTYLADYGNVKVVTHQTGILWNRVNLVK